MSSLDREACRKQGDVWYPQKTPKCQPRKHASKYGQSPRSRCLADTNYIWYPRKTPPCRPRAKAQKAASKIQNAFRKSQMRQKFRQSVAEMRTRKQIQDDIFNKRKLHNTSIMRYDAMLDSDPAAPVFELTKEMRAAGGKTYKSPTRRSARIAAKAKKTRA